MSYRLDFKKLFQDLRGPKGVAALTEELVKVTNEVEKLRGKLQPSAEAKIKKARKTIDDLQGLLKKAQGELDSELKKTVTIVKKYGEQAEKKIQGLAKQVGKKKAAPRKTSKKATSKKKTSKKA